MNVEVWAAIATWAGVVVALGAGIFTGSQARSARRALRETSAAREAAEDQARSARESASAASVSATAAVDQASSARESVELNRMTVHRADQPRFDLDSDVHVHEGDRLHVVARRVAGPPEVTATGRWEASSTGVWPDGSKRIAHQVGSTTIYNVVFGDRIIVPMLVPHWAVEAAIRLDLHCTDVADEERQWDCPSMTDWTSPDHPVV